MCFRLHVKYPLLLPDCNETWIILTDFRKILKCKISWKSALREPSFSMRTDGRTVLKKLWVAFPKFANAPKKCVLWYDKQGELEAKSFSFTTKSQLFIAVPSACLRLQSTKLYQVKICGILIQSWVNSVYRMFVIWKSHHRLILQIHSITYVFLCLSVESQEHLTFEENPVTLTRAPQFGRKKTKKISLECLPLKPLLRRLSTLICLHYLQVLNVVIPLRL